MAALAVRQNPGETPSDALKREVREEIELDMPEASRFTQFDFSLVGYHKVYRIYFEVKVPDMAFRRFVLHEGTDVQAFRGENLLVTRRVTLYDAFALWMHLNRQRSLFPVMVAYPDFCVREQIQSYFPCGPGVLSGRSTKRCP